MIDPRKKPLTTVVGTLLVLMAVVIFYSFVDPEQSKWVPRCIFKSISGYDCPGCGLQRALHAALHGDFISAWHHNAFAIIVVPIAALYVFVELFLPPTSRLYRIMLSPGAAYFMLTATIAWWVLRNI